MGCQLSTGTANPDDFIAYGISIQGGGSHLGFDRLDVATMPFWSGSPLVVGCSTEGALLYFMEERFPNNANSFALQCDDTTHEIAIHHNLGLFARGFGEYVGDFTDLGQFSCIVPDEL